MATIAAVRVDNEDKSSTITWTNLANATSDVGNKVATSEFDDITLVAHGTNGTTVAIHGSQDGTNWTTLGAGMTLTIGATGFSPVTALVADARFIRPATPSAASDTDVIMVGKRRK